MSRIVNTKKPVYLLAILIILMIIALCALAACSLKQQSDRETAENNDATFDSGSSGSVANNENRDDGSWRPPSDYDINDLIINDDLGGMLGVYVLSFETDISPIWARASEVAQRNGFRIAFRPFREPGNYTDIKDYCAIFTDMIRANPGKVFIPRGAVMDDVFKSDVIGDFYVTAATYAPRYLEFAAAANEPGSLRVMPTGLMGEMDRLCVLIRDDMYEKYGGDGIRNTEELEVLLRRIKSGGFAHAPCFNTAYTFSHGNIIDLFFPQMGYISLENLLWNYLRNETYYNCLWMNRETGEVQGLYDLADECAEAVARYERWQSDGLINNRRNEEDGGSLYPVILTNSKNFYELARYIKGYTLNVFTEPNRDEYWFYGTALAASGTDVREFLRFIDWLYADPEYYFEFMNGVEGEDYGFLFGSYTGPWKSEYSKWTHDNFISFIRYDWEPFYDSLGKDADYMDGFEIRGFPEEFIGARRAEFPLDAETRRKIGKTLYDSDSKPGEYFYYPYIYSEYSDVKQKVNDAIGMYRYAKTPESGTGANASFDAGEFIRGEFAKMPEYPSLVRAEKVIREALEGVK